MKKFVSYLIIFALFITMLPVTSFAQETGQRYSNEQMESIVQKYENNEDMLNAMFCDDTYIGYWAVINDIKQNGVLTWALDTSSKLIDEYPEKQDYAEILANLITMQSGELAEQIETQSRFDDLKNIGDYAWDVVEIGAAFVGASGALETISTAISTGVDGVSDVIIQNNDQAKYYEATLQDYSQSFAFLNAISQYAENEELRNVASSLLSANDTLLVKRLEYLADAGGNIAAYEAKFFVENMSMELLKEADLYATDETVKWFVDEGINLKNVLLAAKDAAEAAFKITILAGDIGFGTSDVYNRYQEMKVVADVASSLVKANEATSVPLQTSESKLEAIQEKCNYYKALLVTHARGEYLLYQLLMNDAGAVSDIRWIIEYFKNPEDTTDAWYEAQIEVLTKYCDVLDNMFVVDTRLTEQAIFESLKEALTITEIWYGTSTKYLDPDDVIYADYGGMDWPYLCVIHPDVSSYQDLVELTQQYYTAEASSYLRSNYYLEENGKLYLPSAEGMGGWEVEEIKIRITEQDENTYHILETIVYAESGIENEYVEFNYVCDNSKWLFDTVIWMLDGDSLVLDTDSSIDSSQTTLHTLFQNEVKNNEVYFYYDDFDGDGTNEAYGIVGNGSDGEYTNIQIYFIASDGTIVRVASDIDLYGHCNGLLDTGTSKFIVWNKSAGGSGSSVYLFGVKNGNTYQPIISGEFIWFGCSENDNIYEAESSDWSKGYHDYVTSYYVFDSETLEFIEYGE